MSNDQQRSGNGSVPWTRRKALPIALASGPAEYTAEQQELPVRLTSLTDMVHWAQNWACSRSIWPLGYGLCSSAIEKIAAAPQYDLSRFSSEVFRSSPCQADLMVVAGGGLDQNGTSAAPLVGADARAEVDPEYGKVAPTQVGNSTRGIIP